MARLSLKKTPPKRSYPSHRKVNAAWVCFGAVSLLASSVFISVPAYAQPKGVSVASASPLMNIVQRADEDLLIFDLRLGKTLIYEGLLAYHDADQGEYYVPLADLVQALEFPITVDDQAGRAEGNPLPQRSFLLAMAQGQVIINDQASPLPAQGVERHSDGIYVTLDVLEDWFPVQFDVDFSNLSIKVSSLTPLPIERRMLRDQARAALASGEDMPVGARAISDKIIKPEAPVFTLPFLDVTLQSAHTNRADANKSATLRYTVTGRSIIAGQDAAYSINDDTGVKARPNIRLSLGRKAFEGDSLWGGVKEYGLGDVSTQSMPLIAKSSAGRGAFFTNISPFRDMLSGSDNVTLRGDLPVGYQVDIKRNGELLDFIEEADDNGEYVFEDLFVLPGLNTFELVFYGPQGQEYTEERRVYVGQNPTKTGALDYRFSAIQDDTNLFTDRESNDSDIGKTRLSAEASYGLSDLSSLRAGAVRYSLDGEVKNYGSLGLHTSWRGLSFDLDQAMDSEGQASSARVESAFLGLRLQAQHQYYQDFISEETEGSGLSGNLKHESTLRLSGLLPFKWINNAPLTLTAKRLLNDLGDQQYEWAARITNTIDRLRITTGLEQKIPPNKETETDLNIQISSRFRGYTLRGTAQYALEPDTVLESLNLTSDITIDPLTKLRLGLSRSGVDDPIHAVTAGLSHDVGQAILGFNTIYEDEDSNFTAMLNASFGLAYDTHSQSAYMTSQRLVDRSGISARAFQDSNANHIHDEGEPWLDNVGLKAQGRKGTFTTDEHGAAFVPGLAAFDPAVVELQQNSFPSPFMTSPAQRTEYQLRPSQIHAQNFPIMVTGEIDTTTYMVRAGKLQTAASIIMNIAPADENTPDPVQPITGKSEFDGFVLVQHIPEGRYTIQPDPQQIAQLGYCPSQPQPFTITADEPFASAPLPFILWPRPDLVVQSDFVTLAKDLSYDDAQHFASSANFDRVGIQNPMLDQRFLQPSRRDGLFNVLAGQFSSKDAKAMCKALKASQYLCHGVVAPSCAGLLPLQQAEQNF